MRKIALLAVIAGFTFPVHGQEIQPNTEFHVKLLSPVSTANNRKGDKITAQIVSPAAFAGTAVVICATSVSRASCTPSEDSAANSSAPTPTRSGPLTVTR